MSRIQKVFGSAWMLRGVPLLLLVVGIGLAPVVQAAAPALDDSAAAITVYAPGAPLGSPVAVQFSDGSGHWFTVSGWTSTLDRVTDNLLVPYKQFTVFAANFGQGPFRWVVYQMDGKTVWGISDSFNLPSGGGINQTETIVPGVTGVTSGTPATSTPVAPAPAPTASMATPVPPANSSLLLTNTGSSYMTLAGTSDSSLLSGYFLGLPANSWIAVQWGGVGNWQTVPGWQGTADTTDSTTGQLIKQFSVAPANYGQGPFRWAVFDKQGGTLLGYTDNFTLPTYSGVNFFMSFSK